MAPFIKKYGVIITWVLVAASIILSALIWKDTPYEDAWLYILAAGFVFVAALELYSKKK